MAARAVFWGAAGLIGWTIAGLPAALAVRARLRPLPVPGDGPPVPLTVVVAAHDEEAVIADKVANALALDYPPGLLTVVVACDGCADRTAELARDAGEGAGGRVQVLELPRGGKNAALRAAIPAAPGDVLLFTDADAMFAPDVARRLVAPLSDPAIGGAAGRVRFARGDGASGEAAYWSLEDRLRALQTRGGSLTAAPGPIFAVRREHADPPPDGVTDDFWISVQVPLSGRRLVFVPEAVASLPAPPGARDEFRRKVRIMCAGLRGVWLSRRRMRGRWIDVQVVTHKALRRLLVVPGLVMIAAGLGARRHGLVYRCTGAAGAAGVLAAAAAWCVRDTRLRRLPAVPLAAHAAGTAWASLVALRDLVRGERHDRWRHDA